MYDNQRQRRKRVLMAAMAIGGAGGVVYTLRDTFFTDIAAGSVNGTLADTGQARTVTDTNSKLSLVGGQVSVAAGGVGSGDPGLWYPSIVTVAGRILICDMTPANTGPGGMFGFDANQAGLISEGIRFQSGNVLQVQPTGVNVALFTAAVTYKNAIIQRTLGFFHFFKGGSEYLNNILLWVGTTSAPGTWFPGVVSNQSGVFTADNIRIPAALYIPVPLAYDTFTRADGALGSTETAGPDAQVLTALVWNFTTGVWTISTNKAIATPTPGSDVIVNGGFGADTDWTKGSGWSIAAGVAAAVTASSNLSATVAPLTANRFYLVVYTVSAFAAGTVQVVIGGKSMPTHAANATYTEIGLATTTAFLFTGAGFTGSLDNVSTKALLWSEVFATVACATADIIIDAAVTVVGATSGLPEGIVTNLDSTSSPANFVLVYFDGNANVVILEMVAGVITVKQTTAVTYSAGAVLRVIRDGTMLRAFYNNAAVGVVQTMTANTAKNHGVFDPTALNSLDNVTIWARGTSNEYTALDAY